MTAQIFPSLTHKSQIDFMSNYTYTDDNYIINRVSESLQVDKQDIISRSRKREHTEARQICIHLIKKHSKMLLKQIGGIFNQHHSTIIYSIQVSNDLYEVDPKFRAKVDRITLSL